MASKDFQEHAEKVREELRSSRSSTDLYVAKDADIAVIGIQNSSGGSGHDTIYVLNGKNSPRKVLDETFIRGRMFPKGISDNGKTFTYVIKSERGHFSEDTKET